MDLECLPKALMSGLVSSFGHQWGMEEPFEGRVHGKQTIIEMSMTGILGMQALEISRLYIPYSSIMMIMPL